MTYTVLVETLNPAHSLTLEVSLSVTENVLYLFLWLFGCGVDKCNDG